MNNLLKSIAVLTCLLFSIQLVYGEHIEKKLAKQVASDWINYHGIKKYQDISVAKEFKHKDVCCIYLFGFEEGGFVLVSADDQVNPVLGYSLDTKIENNYDLYPAVQDWITSYELQIYEVITKEINNPVQYAKWTKYLNKDFPENKNKDVEPLIDAMWSQGVGWNTFCPEDEAGSGGHAQVGCVATSMGQLIKYWDYPEHGLTSNSYYHNDYKWIHADFGSTYYQWNEMENVEPTNAAALLLFHCGVSVEMNYGPSGSGASSAQIGEALARYFGFSSNSEYISKFNYTEEQWKTILKNELDNERPMCYRGSATEGGHAFNCDGYDNNDYFHFNWGWGGSYNGYYTLDDLSPGGYNFTSAQAATIGIEPDITQVSADFEADITWGGGPLQVNFTDISGHYINPPLYWEWDFNEDGIIDSYEQNPSFIYNEFDDFNIELTVSNGYNVSTLTKISYIHVRNPLSPIYVSLDGSDETGDGSFENPYRTIQHGINLALDILIIKDGVYEETIDFNNYNITVGSMFMIDENLDHIYNTIIYGSGPGSGAIVSFKNHETNFAKLCGLTITNGGSGIYCEYSDPILKNLIISGNESTHGAGIRLVGSSSKIENTVISGNKAIKGSGVASLGSDPLFSHVTITGNYSSVEGGGLWCLEDISTTLVNSIIWNNYPDEISGELNVMFSNVMNGYLGLGNINLDPNFVTPIDPNQAPTISGDFHLEIFNYCIEAGVRSYMINEGLYICPHNDIEGSTRPMPGPNPDMGAYESSNSNNCIHHPEGTISWWPLDNLQEEITPDIIGDNDGIIMGEILENPVSGMVNNAHNFEGENYILVPHDESLDFGDESFAIIAWVNGVGVAVAKYDSKYPGYILGINESDGRVIFYMKGKYDDMWQQFVSEESIIDYYWNFIAVVLKKNLFTVEVKLYINGIEQSFLINNPGSISNKEDLTIGTDIQHVTNNFIGQIDEVALIGYYLTLEELDEIYYARSAGMCKKEVSNHKGNIMDIAITDVDENIISLSVNPNPLNTFTTIKYSIYSQTQVRISVYNLNGQLVKTLVDGEKSAGTFSIGWDAYNESGYKLPSGIYFLNLETHYDTQNQKIIIK